MNLRIKLPKRASILVGVAMLTAIGSAPLLSDAQTASPVSKSDQIAQGEEIFNSVCIACHQAGGVGVPGIYPALNGNPLLTLDDPTYFISTVLTGRGGMPSFRTTYDDEQVASIVTFVRQAWDNNAPAVTADEVKVVRDQVTAPAPPLGTEPEGQIPRGNIPSTPDIPVPTVATPTP